MSKLTFEEIISKPKANYQVIPLGIKCTVANYLNLYNLRKYALPFDWNVTPIQSAIELLSNDFDGFLCRDNLFFGTQRQVQLLLGKRGINLKSLGKLTTPVLCQRYNIMFAFDFLDSSDKAYQDAYLKYSRRIQRLKDLLVSEEIDLIFVAHDEPIKGWEMEQYELGAKIPLTNNFQNWKNELSIVLAKYPKLNYALCDFSHFSSYFGAPSSLRYKIRKRISQVRFMVKSLIKR